MAAFRMNLKTVLDAGVFSFGEKILRLSRWRAVLELRFTSDVTANENDNNTDSTV